MATDNVTLSPNNGSGATMRTLADNTNAQWVPAVVAFATSVDTNGVSVLSFATSSAGLPVAQQGSWTVAANQNGTWAMTASAGTNLNTAALAKDTSVNGVLLAQNSTTAGQSGPLIQGAVTSAAAAYTNGQTSPLSLDTNGNLRVNVVVGGGGGGGGASSAFNAAWPANGTAIGVLSSNGVNMVGMSVDAGGLLKVNGAGATQPVSGTVAATQSGAWNLVNANLVNTVTTVTTVSALTGITNTVVVNGSVNAIQSGSWNITNTSLVNTLTTITNPVTVANNGTFAVNANQAGSWNITNTNLVNTVTTVTTVSALTSITNTVVVNGSVNAIQSGTWNVANTNLVNTVTTVTAVTAITNTVVVNGSVNAIQSGSWNIANTSLVNSVSTVNTLTGITNTVVVNGTVNSAQSGTWNVTNANLVNSVTVVNAVTGITNTVVVNGTVNAAQSGTWNITNTNLVNTVASVTAIANALPAGTNLLGQVSASGETNTIYEGTSALTPLFAAFTINTNGATTVVNGTASKRIRVVRWGASTNAAVNFYWQSNTNSVQISGTRYMTQYASAGGAYTVVGHFQTANGDALQGVASTNGPISGELTYLLV